MCHLKALEKKGLITRESYMSRAIKLTGAPTHTQNLAFLGTASSGEPFVEAQPSDDAVDFLGLLTGDDKVTIRFRGSGCKTLGIDDGDHLIIRRRSCLTTGSLVATLDDRNHMILC